MNSWIKNFKQYKGDYFNPLCITCKHRNNCQMDINFVTMKPQYCFGFYYSQEYENAKQRSTNKRV